MDDKSEEPNKSDMKDQQFSEESARKETYGNTEVGFLRENLTIESFEGIVNVEIKYTSPIVKVRLSSASFLHPGGPILVR